MKGMHRYVDTISPLQTQIEKTNAAQNKNKKQEHSTLTFS